MWSRASEAEISNNSTPQTISYRCDRGVTVEYDLHVVVTAKLEKIMLLYVGKIK